MADSDQQHKQASFAANSYDTALCIIPPQQWCEEIDKLRSLYDKAYEKWPPHINLIYPFVAPERLLQAKKTIESHLDTNFDGAASRTMALGGAGLFKHRKDTTIFLRINNITEDVLVSMRSAVLQALGLKVSPSVFHLTVGQAQDNSVSARQFLLDKVNLMPAFDFDAGSLVILIREKRDQKADPTSQMRLWGSINLSGSDEAVHPPMTEFWTNSASLEGAPSDVNLVNEHSSSNERQGQPGTTFVFNPQAQNWTPAAVSSELSRPTTLSVSSYNVLIDSEYPPSRDRDPLLVETILAESALADVVVLQEVSDGFLSHLLQVVQVREAFPYASHGPPSQPDIGPLPSLRNIVMLSKWHFSWEFVPFQRRHKGAIVASFSSILESEYSKEVPLVVAGVHLTAGLTDGSVAAKKIQLQNVISILKRKYSASPWIVAGDFNLPTSRYTIDEAVKEKSISRETSHILELTESTMSESGLLDAWAVARVEGVDKTAALDADGLFEGEEGATFNPHENSLAAYISGTPENRPQRYDRIFMRPQDKFALTGFIQFGRPEIANGTTSVASDHYGIRATFQIHPETVHQSLEERDILQRRVVYHKHAPPQLSSTAVLTEALSGCAVFPTQEDEERYRQAFGIIKEVLLGSAGGELNTPEIPMVIVPVGSYALNVWTADSDIDCLCIGSISSMTFFQLARQRILKADVKGIRILRKVEANTGTMLELSVNGVNMDLQYCPAANVVHRWSQFPTLSATDPIFNLSILSLRKLKPIRDLTYLQRTLPSLASFRLAYHSIKRWAVERGIYSAKFGYFGGIHITLMLSWVCKRLAHDMGHVSAGDLVLSFFYHYANFDWQNDMVYDAFFHKKKPRYQRSAREPMVILGFHAPNSNIAHTATAPGLQVLVNELKQADARLSSPGMTWEHLLHVDTPGSKPAIENFLDSFDSYVKIDIQYWGRTLSRGKGLVGWIESRCISLVVDIHKALPKLSSRIWPARFAENEANDSDTYYHGSYLVGLSRSNDDTLISQEERTEARAALQKVFDRFLTQVRADDKYYDESSAWIGVGLVKPAEVKGLRLDAREWGDYLPDLEPESDDEEEFDELDDDLALPTGRRLPVRSAPSSTSTPVSSNKLRPASDVLNRLRWDSNLDPSDYIVGYEDRFLGAKETTLERWKTEQTDEEFIPQHRILYFKRKSEDGGEVVWERSTRIDRIFGSGIGSGE
ncbi:uncharacterized protein N0V89_009938 [Didymosphaeria variabile]|uniref:polynucleotide adenylyltransferase n=1 Tax=Didymosphaeria variabile TaxID=1932322 RepID=A0A9W8XG22_9PLEO|nr:uncharacterized protein N0V89_009938 [Didymosphaeria variabile]KAJ4348561.1 hypothetical protein N0V89_009938 [Didymosphaeria variabile]